MSPTVALIVFIAAIVVTVILGNKFKCNIGIIGICFAFIIGTIFMKLSISQVIGFFPTSLLFQMMIVTFFYGFAAENGTIKVVSSHLIYAMRKNTKLLPFVLFLVTFLVSAIGAGAGATPVIMSPIAFTLAAQMGFNPVLALIATYLGSMGGGLQAWSSSGILFKGVAEQSIGEALATSAGWAYGVTLFIIPTIFFLAVFFIVSRKDKTSGSAADVIAEPQKMNREQKITFTMIIVMMVLVIVPVFANMFFPNPATKWFASKFDIKVLCAIGIVLCCAFKVGDAQKVVKNYIPWNMIIMVCGMSVLITIGVKAGITDVIGNFFSSSMPKFLIIPMVIIISGLLSFVTTGPAVIFPLFIPMFTAISANTGLSVVALTVACYAGTGATGLSPFSQGGAMAVVGCTDENLRNSLWKKQFILAICFLLTYVVVALLGYFNLLGAIFG